MYAPLAGHKTLELQSEFGFLSSSLLTFLHVCGVILDICTTSLKEVSLPFPGAKSF